MVSEGILYPALVAIFRLLITPDGYAYHNDVGSLRQYGPRGEEQFDKRNYYASTVPVSWSTANRDCRQVFAERGATTGHLLSIESQAELRFVHEEVIGPQNSGKTYWTSGSYSRGGWVWWQPRGSVPSFVQIQKGAYPPSTMDRLVINYDNDDLEIEQDSTPQRYICEADLPSRTD